MCVCVCGPSSFASAAKGRGQFSAMQVIHRGKALHLPHAHYPALRVLILLIFSYGAKRISPAVDVVGLLFSRVTSFVLHLL